MIIDNSFTHDPRVYNEARSLINAGHEITVLAWNKFNVETINETLDGIHIYRVNNSKFMKMIPFDLLTLCFWWKKAYKESLKLYENKPFDVVHCHDFASLPIGVKLKKKLGIKLVYDAHEIWGYMIAKRYPMWFANYYLWREKGLLPHVDKFIIAEDGYSEYFKLKTSKEMTAILNCKPIITKEYNPTNNEKLSLLYIGILNSARYILEIIDVIKDIKDVECIIGGVGLGKFIDNIKQNCSKTNNVKFIGKVPPEKVLPMTKDSDVVLCMINPNVYNNKIATANKQFEAMVCGRPIICTKDTRSGEITENENCGIVVDFNKESLKQGIIKLRDSPDVCEELGKNALNAAVNKYNWETEKKKLLKLYESLEV